MWLEVIASIKALFDVGKGAVDLTQSIERYRSDQVTILEAQRVSGFSTYSDEEVEELLHRIRGCVKKFIAQGDGADRVRCMCSVLNEAKAGNGGTLPQFDDWLNIYEQLNCASVGAGRRAFTS